MAVYRRRLPHDHPDDAPTGPWEVKVRGLNGKQVVRRLDPRNGEPITGKRHARNVEAHLLNELHGNPHADHPTATLHEFSRRWWAQHVTAHVKPETQPNYRLHLTTRILPHLGEREVGTLRVSDIDQWMATLAAAGDNPPTVNKARTVLSSILGRAVKWEVIPANPCTAADRIREVKRKRRYLTVDEVRRIADECRNLRDRTMILVGAFTGLRPSELLGLTIEHVHPTHVHVEWQLAEAVVRDQRVVTPPRLVTPKDYETGDIELPDLAREALTEWLASGAPRPRIATPAGDTLRLVFGTVDGKPMSLRTWRRSCFGPAAIRAGLGQPVIDPDGNPVMTPATPGRRAKPKVRPLVTPNDLRHFYPSFLRSLQPPASPEYICARMRHHDPAFTMSTYGDLFAAPAAPVVDAMNQALAR